MLPDCIRERFRVWTVASLSYPCALRPRLGETDMIRRFGRLLMPVVTMVLCQGIAFAQPLPAAPVPVMPTPVNDGSVTLQPPTSTPAPNYQPPPPGPPPGLQLAPVPPLPGTPYMPPPPP